MPNWKKVITSGSDASLNTLSVDNNTHLSGSLNVFKSGSTVFTIEGSQGTLFQITDQLSGSLFAVSDISGVPSFEVFSDDTVKLGTFGSEAVVVEGSSARVTGSFSGSADFDTLKLKSLSNQSSEATAVVINGSNVVGTRELGSNAFTSTTIPTNNNQLTNGAGYITDGNTGWTNSYGFITGVDWDEIGGTQDSINISGFNNDSGFTTNVGDITGVTAGVGLSGGGSSGAVTLTLDMSELTDMTATMLGTDEFIVLDAGADRRKAANEIGLSIFSNDSGFITGLNWSELGGSQSDINLSGFNNDLTLSSFTNDAGFVAGDVFDEDGTFASLRAQGTTKGDVGLGNVTNESKATMFSSPAFTGSPTAPTQTGTDDSTKIATTAFVQDRIDTIIGNAGSTLDTLGELSASLSDDQDALTSLTTTVGTKLAKSSNLSDLTNASTARTNLGLGTAATTNSTAYATAAQGTTADSAVQPADSVTTLSDVSDAGSGAIITDAERTKLSGIATGAEVNVQSDWNATSGDALILNKPTTPTNNSQLTNGAGYITSYVNTNQLTTFQVEDGDGTEVTISHAKEWKFVEAGGININWTDTSNGSDTDPYDLSF